MAKSLRPAAFPLAVLLLGSALVPNATAHAELADSDPEPDARLSVAPTAVWVVLTERIEAEGARLEVRDANRTRWDSDDLQIENGEHPTLRATLRPDAPEGSYQVRWAALSAVDGHYSSGSFGFAIGDHEPPASQYAAQFSAASAAGRSLIYAGLALAFSAVAFLFFLKTTCYDAPLARRWLLAGATLHAAGAAVLAAATWDASTVPAARFLSSGTGTQFALRLSLAVTALACAAVATLGSRPRFAWPAAALLVASAAMSARLGHLAAHGWPSIAGDTVHLVLATTWVGGLVLLLHYLATRRPAPDEVRQVGVQFGALALACVAGLAATGLASSVAILGWSGLWPALLLESTYGRVLAAKVALTSAMVAIAGVNRYVFLRPNGPIQKLSTAVTWEAGAGLAILALAGALASISPP